ncbi:hypothetical protein Q757_02655 [Oenococcus alcoholitolerans]|uniref:ABC transporter domain-containing protein n=1 Tax=Oenococcus alcoholitolerans TaxID=931074 RepID=A0ABR4XSU3_9LACO|nr:hypothetical protein Q757_02655 [Oenococcus alcoholitolerans]
MTEAVLSLKNISVVVNKTQNNQTEILKGLDLDIYKGDFITVIGANGAGKSTFFNVIAGTQAVDSGQIIHNGKKYKSVIGRKTDFFFEPSFSRPENGYQSAHDSCGKSIIGRKTGPKTAVALAQLEKPVIFF